MVKTETPKHIKRTWIIGASAGIGAALAEKLAIQGEMLCLSARNADALEALKNKIDPDNKHGHLVSSCDVSNIQQLQSSFDLLKEQWGHIDSIIFMAGLYKPTSIEAINLDDIDKILHVNLHAPFYLLHTVVPFMKAQSLKTGQKPQIALCASVAGYRGLPNAQPYGASKAGLINLTQSLRAELGDVLDIKVINPGFVETRLTDKNDFDMPMRITPNQAADAIVKGLNKKGFEIAFPSMFIILMKLMSILPDWLYYRLMKQK